VLDSKSQAFVFSVDELGNFLVIGADELVIGHARGAGVDLPFLADVGREHARLVRKLSFRGGISWSIVALRGERVLVGGEPCAEEGTQLANGDLVQLGVNLVFRYAHPDPASTTAVLELERGADCLGTGAIVLLGEGEPGALRLGAGSTCHLRSGILKGELRLTRWPEGLALEGDELERFHASSSESGQLEPDAEGRLKLSTPLVGRVDLQIGPATESDPPFGVALSPQPAL